MTVVRTRRAFLSDVGRGMLTAAVGPSLALDMGFAQSAAAAAGADGPVPAPELTFGPLERLVRQLQETPVADLNALLVGRLGEGTDLRTLTAAAALANARTFGGDDYVGFHTLMALGPAYRMSAEMPAGLAPLPVLKVLYRNTARIGERGGRANEVLRPVDGDAQGTAPADGAAVRGAIRVRDLASAERLFADVACRGPDDALNAVLVAVQDDVEVHRVVLPYRAWDLLDVVGREHAHTLLRQSVRYCAAAEAWPRSASHERPRHLLPTLMERFKLLDKARGDRPADDAFVERLSQSIFAAAPDAAAESAAAALADGFAPDAVGEAISLAANQLVLRDRGRTPRDEVAGKPIGSVHGDSIGVHACDSANAWRNLARVANARNAFACLILGAYQVALDRVDRGGDFLAWDPLPLARHVEAVRPKRRRRCSGTPRRRSAETSRPGRRPSSTGTGSSVTRRGRRST